MPARCHFQVEARAWRTKMFEPGGATQTFFRDKIWMCTAKSRNLGEGEKTFSLGIRYGKSMKRNSTTLLNSAAGPSFCRDFLRGLARQQEHVGT